MPGLDELTRRYEAVCGEIDDSIVIMKDIAGGKPIFTFNMEDSFTALQRCNTDLEVDFAESTILLMGEYIKLLKAEGRRRNILKQIESKRKRNGLKEEVKKRRRNQRMATTTPYTVLTRKASKEKIEKND